MSLATLLDLGTQLDADVFPNVRDGGFVVPGRPAIQSKSSGTREVRACGVGRRLKRELRGWSDCLRGRDVSSAQTTEGRADMAEVMLIRVRRQIYVVSERDGLRGQQDDS